MRFDIRRLLTARTSVLALMSILLLAVVLSYIIPQRFSTPEAEFVKWQAAHRAWLPVIEFLGLHRLFSTPWFVGLLAVFWISLVFAAKAQFRAALVRTFGCPCSAVTAPELDGDSFQVDLSVGQLARGLQRAGYFRIAAISGAMRYVKHPWGYWGVFLLHLGIMVAVAASLFIAATEKRGALRLAEGELHLPSSPWLVEERGPFASPFRLPEAVRLDRLTPEFWEPGGLKNLQSELSFIAPDGVTTRRSLALAAILDYRGLRIYQEANFGHVFYLRFTDRAGVTGEVALDLAGPIEAARPSYGDFDFAEIPYHLKAKYYADAARETLVSDNPQLVMRLIDRETVIGELALGIGEGGLLGPYQVRLVRLARWAGFVFLQTPGVSAVFAGFAIFILGVMLNYFTIPREFLVQTTGGGYRVTWNGSKYRRLYLAEYRRVEEQLRQQERNG